MEPVAPCKDCPEREIGCHERCEKYQTFRKDRREFNSQMQAISNYDAYLTERKAKIRDNIDKKKKR